jgi:uncharacterized membrane protein YciS (DUF1049 family)
MSNLWLRIKIWFKVALVAAVFLYIILFTGKNASKEVQFWYWFNHQPETNLLFLVLCAFVAGVVVSFLVRTTLLTVRQISELQQRARAQRMDRQIADIHSKAAMLQTKPPGVAPVEEVPKSEDDV